MGVITRPKDMQDGMIYQTKAYGDLEIIGYEGNKRVKVRFLDTQYETYTRSWLIRTGSVKDMLKPVVCGVGFIGDGKHSAYINSKKSTEAYSVWHMMLYRCYEPAAWIKHPTYQGVLVCDEWHNFQNFAEWFYTNKPKDGNKYDLDKDKKGGSIKVYSPMTCQFLTAKENRSQASDSKRKKATLISPLGEEFTVWNQANFCCKQDLNRAGLCNLISGKLKTHKGWKLKEIVK